MGADESPQGTPLMDISDRATQREEFDRHIAMLKHAAHAPGLPVTGACHWCDALLPAGARFCDKDCLDDWQREQDARQRGGWRA